MEIDWSTLRRLREGFLEGTAGVRDYWQSLSDLAQYDATFAQRIGWKWDFVLADLRRLGWRSPGGVLLDWGCGSGVASRAVLDHEGTEDVRELWLSDRSNLAVEFASNRVMEKYPDLSVRVGKPSRMDLLIISHVLTELPPGDVEELIAQISAATSVIWVEPGTHETSLKLIAIRERLRGRFKLVAPCPHQGRCGILAPGNESHWCHQFAPPPEFVFTDAFWTMFAHTMEVDLRSLPLSYLVLDRREPDCLPADAVRILGRPKVFKPYASLLGCAGAGLIEGEVARRDHAAVYRQLKKGRYPSLQSWQREGKQIKKWNSIPPRTTE